MKKIIIASKNPVKIQAVRNGFAKMFEHQSKNTTRFTN